MNTSLASPAPAPLADGRDADFTDRISQSQRSYRARRRRRSIFVLVAQIGSFAAALAGWELATRTGLLDELFFSKPSEVGALLKAEWPLLWESTVVTIRATTIGFVIGSAGAIVTALLLARFPTLDRIVQPWISVLMSLPRIALAPLFLLWFGITETSKVALAVSVVYFMVLVPVLGGMKIVDPDLVTMSRTFHASEFQRFRTIVIPSALPGIFAGLRLGVVSAVLGVVASEMIASSSGLGLLISNYGQSLKADGVFAVLFLLAVITTCLYLAIAALERWLLRWQAD